MGTRGVGDEQSAASFNWSFVHWSLIACLSLTLQACGRSQKSQVIHEITSRFPNGKTRCLQLGNLPGIHVGQHVAGTLYYPSAGPTSPINHLFVFYAARFGQPLPELVADLLDRGMLTKETVQATADQETSTVGPQVVSPTGNYSNLTIYSHRSTSFSVEVYTTKPYDPALAYAIQMPVRQVWAPTGSFPSRLYDVPLPANDRHYTIPTIDPFALSIVAGACLTETPDRVQEIRVKDAADGGHFAEADVLFEQHPPAWMTTRAFRRAALGPDVDWIDKPRLATIVFKMTGDGKLSYAYEKAKW